MNCENYLEKKSAKNETTVKADNKLPHVNKKSK